MDKLGIIAAFTRLRGRVLERVRKVNETTERGTLAAGSHLDQVVRIAREHIEHLRDLLSGPVSASDSSLQRAIANQAAHVRSHGDKLDESVARHASKVSAVAEAARQITAAAKEIERANAAARVLSLNARVEASRAGAHAFSAIATEMHALSRAIVGANGRVQALATAMEATLPELVDQSEALRQLVSEYTQEARGQIDQVETEVSLMKQSIETSLRSSDGALAAIIAASHEGLSALQFQDVCAQSLLQLDRWQETALREAATALACDAEVAPAVSAISNEDSILDHGNAGEVLMF